MADFVQVIGQECTPEVIINNYIFYFLKLFIENYIMANPHFNERLIHLCS